MLILEPKFLVVVTVVNRLPLEHRPKLGTNASSRITQRLNLILLPLTGVVYLIGVYGRLFPEEVCCVEAASVALRTCKAVTD